MSQDDPGPAAPEGAGSAASPPLAATVTRLRDEAEGLRRALRTRAVIEQAKGMLMERHGIGEEDAFARLSRLSQHANIKLVDVAAALVETGLTASAHPAASPAGARGSLSPPTPTDLARQARQAQTGRWPRQGSADTPFGREVRLRAGPARTRAALLAAQRPGDVLAALAAHEICGRVPVVAVLAQADHAGVVHLLGSHGIAPSVAARWQRFPLDLAVPLCEAARSGTVLWLDRDDAGATGAADAGPPGACTDASWGTLSFVPVASQDGVVVLAAAWEGREILEGKGPETVERLARAAATALTRTTNGDPQGADDDPGERSRGPDSVGAAPLMEVAFHPLLLCRGETDDDGVLRILTANAAAAAVVARRPDQLAGCDVLEVFPDAADAGLVQRCTQVVRTGRPAVLRSVPWAAGAAHGDDDAGTVDVRISRYGSDLLVAWDGKGVRA